MNHVLILAPYRRDADYLSRLMSEHAIPVATSSDVDIDSRLKEGPEMLVTTHEALSPRVTDLVAKHLDAQPPWAEMPIVVLLDRASATTRIQSELVRVWPRARHTFYQRPVAPVELVSGVKSALMSRVRQRDVRDHIDREIELRRELNHRVKNILASVTSIFEMTRRNSNSIEELTADFSGRLGALGKVHSAVFHADGESVSIDEIVDITFQPYQLLGGDRFVAAGPSLVLSREAGTTLALCLHELTTNALKYGALSVPEGRVALHWFMSSESGEVSLSWCESGGPSVREPARVGYGTRYLRSALRGMFGTAPEISFRPEGLVCTAAGPFARMSARS
jgi:two-component sensor histidine kinase